MAPLTPYARSYSFTDYQASNPSAPLPGTQVDNELENVETSLGEAINAIKDIRRSDGKLANGVVTVDSLSPNVSPGFSLRGQWAGGVTYRTADCVIYDSDMYRSNSSHVSAADTRPDLDDTTWTFLFATSDFAGAMSVSAYDPTGVGADAFNRANHYGTVTPSDGTVTSAKIVDGTIATGDLADDVLSADTTGRAKMADGFVNAAKMADDVVSGQTSKAIVVDADEFLIGDSAASGVKKRAAFSALWTWAQTKILALFNASGSAPVYAIRAWANFNGTGTVTARQAGNVAAITRSSTGVFDVAFITAMPDADYVVAPVGGASSIDTTVSVSNQTASGFRLFVVSAGVASDQPNIGFVVCR